MKQYVTLGALLLLCFPCLATNNNPKTIFVPRSQGTDWARHLSGTTDHTNKFDMQTWYGYGAATVSYSQSFNSCVITDYLFGLAADKNSIHFSGSKAVQPGTYDLVADYFGLPTDFKSTVKLKPQIQNVVVDLDFYVGCDSYAEGTYFALYAPVCFSRWNLHASEQVTTPGANSFEAGYMAKTPVANSNLQKSALTVLNGGTVFGDMQEPLAFGKIISCGSSKTRVADVTTVWGWNVINCDNHHLGIELRSTFATSNRPTGEFLFEPLVGNGGHFELGVGISAHMMLWECDSENFLSFYTHAQCSHMFATRQTRSFDFKRNGQTSRYILAQQFQQLNRFNPNGHLDNPGIRDEYAGKLLPAINLTTLCCSVSNDVQGQINMFLNYRNCGFSWDIGYSFWGRTQEKIKITDTIRSGNYTLKGDSFIYGTATNAAVTNIIPLSASQQQTATAFRGANTNSALNVGGVAQELNPQVDNAEFAFAQVNTVANVPVNSIPLAGQQINTSVGVEFITIESLDIDSATAPAQMTNKLFTALTFTWDNIVCTDSTLKGAVPFMGFGAEVEFDSNSSSEKQHCSRRSALNQWSVWGKFGLAF